MAVDASVNLSRKRLILSALCKHLSLDPSLFLSDLEANDIKGLYMNAARSKGNAINLNNSEEVMKWIGFAESFPSDPNTCLGSLKELNEDLVYKSVLSGKGLKPSEADVIIFAAVHSSLIGLSDSDKDKFPHVLRWADYIQNKCKLGDLFEKLLLMKTEFDPEALKNALTVRNDAKGKKAELNTKDKPQADVQKKSNEAKSAVAKATSQEESVSLLNIQVGLIRKAWKHPSADSLLVEEIDVGEAKVRQVVSGLAKYCSPDDLLNRRVVLITNVKPGKLRDIMSEGLVLCASNEDHSVVEPLIPPEDAIIGERVSFSGIDGKPEDVLNPKKKQFDKIKPHLFTDDKGVATFKGIPFMTSGGPCISSIPKATVG